MGLFPNLENEEGRRGALLEELLELGNGHVDAEKIGRFKWSRLA
jgi:hypothetical protein